MRQTNNPLNNSGNANNNSGQQVGPNQQGGNSIPLPRYPISSTGSNQQLNLQNVQLNQLGNNQQRGNPMMNQNRNMLPQNLSSSNNSLGQNPLTSSNFPLPSSGGNMANMGHNIRTNNNNNVVGGGGGNVVGGGGGSGGGGPLGNNSLSSNSLSSNNPINFLRTSNGSISQITPINQMSQMNQIPSMNSMVVGQLNPMVSTNMNMGQLNAISAMNSMNAMNSMGQLNASLLSTGINNNAGGGIGASAVSSQGNLNNNLNNSNNNIGGNNSNNNRGPSGGLANHLMGFNQSGSGNGNVNVNVVGGPLSSSLSSSSPSLPIHNSMGMFQNNMHSSANSLGNGSIIESSSPPNSTVNFDMINDFPALNNHQQHRPSSSDLNKTVEYKLQSKEDFPALGAYKPNSSSNSSSNANLNSNSSPHLPSPSPSSSSNPSQNPSSNETQLRAASSSLPNTTDASVKRGENNKYDLMGLLGVIRMTDPNLNMLALGADLTSLGLNLNSPNPLYVNFTSPFADGNRKDMLFDFAIPPCYKIPSQMQSLSTKINLFSEEILFYIFYSMPKDQFQLLSSLELYRREWKFHVELQRWIQKIPADNINNNIHNNINNNNNSSTNNNTSTNTSTSTSTSNSSSTSTTTAATATSNNGNSYYVFEPKVWEKVRKDNFILSDLFEDEKNVANFLQLYNNSNNNNNNNNNVNSNSNNNGSNNSVNNSGLNSSLNGNLNAKSSIAVAQ